MYKKMPNKMPVCKKKQDEDLCMKKGQFIIPCIKKGFFCHISTRLLGSLIDKVDKKKVSL